MVCTIEQTISTKIIIAFSLFSFVEQFSTQNNADTHLSNAGTSNLGGAEALDAGSGNSDGSYGEGGEFHGCFF